MKNLSNIELHNIKGGSISTPFDLIYKLYRIIKIKILMKSIFTN